MFHPSRIHRRQQGFTLIELMVTIAILAILAAIAYPSYETYIQRARMDNARAAMTDVIHQMERNYTARNSFCATAASTPAAACASSPDFSAVTNAKEGLKYTIAFGNGATHATTAGRFTLFAEPQNGLYSANTLGNRLLFIFYDSTSATFARCNSTGIASVRSNNDPGNNCEVY